MTRHTYPIDGCPRHCPLHRPSVRCLPSRCSASAAGTPCWPCLGAMPPPPLDRIQSLWAGGRGGGQPEPLLAKESLGEGRKSASFRKRTLMRGRGGPNQTGPQHRSASGVLFPLFRRKGPVGEPPTFTHAESGGGGGILRILSLSPSSFPSSSPLGIAKHRLRTLAPGRAEAGRAIGFFGARPRLLGY